MSDDLLRGEKKKNLLGLGDTWFASVGRFDLYFLVTKPESAPAKPDKQNNRCAAGS